MKDSIVHSSKVETMMSQKKAIPVNQEIPPESNNDSNNDDDSESGTLYCLLLL